MPAAKRAVKRAVKKRAAKRPTKKAVKRKPAVKKQEEISEPLLSYIVEELHKFRDKIRGEWVSLQLTVDDGISTVEVKLECENDQYDTYDSENTKDPDAAFIKLQKRILNEYNDE